MSPRNTPEIAALEADAGRYLVYVRAVARRTWLRLEKPLAAIPSSYEKRPLLRNRTR